MYTTPCYQRPHTQVPSHTLVPLQTSRDDWGHAMKLTQRALVLAVAAQLARAAAASRRYINSSPSLPTPIATTQVHDNCYEFVDHGERRTVCLPHIIIGGFPKCGTSALFALVSSHPDAVGTHGKEHCMFFNETAAFLEGLPSMEALGGKRLVSGCIALEHNEAMFELLQPRMPVQVILTVRDYADMAWASFNFWCVKWLDRNCSSSNGWWTLPEHYRSPELFHELMVMQKEGAINALRTGNVFNDPLPYTNVIVQYERLVGPDRVLILDSDELQHNPRSAWRKIAKFTGLSNNHPHLHHFETVLYNTHSARGQRSHSKSRAHRHGVYPISGHRPMLASTRALLDTAWMQDCVTLNKQYNLTLRACAGV